MKANIYQLVTERIVEQLRQDIIPWQKPWTGAADGAVSYATGRAYSFINQMLLGRGGEWLTFKQIKALGGKINKGAKAGMVVFYRPYLHEEKNEQGEVIKVSTIPILKSYNVFHIEDCTGIESKYNTEHIIPLQPIDEAEKVISSYVEREGLNFHNDKPSGKAYYSPMSDEVVVPMLNQYEIAEEYYSTTFHELTHSTMKESRCNRREGSKVAAFGGDDYSREELVAEIGSAMLCSYVGIDCEKAFNNSVAYIQGWISQLSNDTKAIVWASSRAEKAARYILNIKDNEEKASDNE